MIIGKNGDIDKHLADQKSFNEGTTEKDMADFRHVVTEMTKLVAVMEKEGFSLFVIGKLKEFYMMRGSGRTKLSWSI